jgi:aminoglycoside phosphotransferase family enzyme
METKNQAPQLNIELNEDVAQGVYSNLAVITHSPAEFVVDFIRVMPGVPKARVQSRIIVTPQHAKRLMKALAENIAKYESQHGKIQETAGAENMFPVNFGGPHGQA